MELYLPMMFCSERAEFVEVAAQAEDDFFGVELLAGVVGGTMLGAAAAFDAGVGLKAGELGEIFSGDEAEVFVSYEGGNFAEASAREKDGGGAEDQVEVLGVGNEWEETGGWRASESTRERWRRGSRSSPRRRRGR